MRVIGQLSSSGSTGQIFMDVAGNPHVIFKGGTPPITVACDGGTEFVITASQAAVVWNLYISRETGPLTLDGMHPNGGDLTGQAVVLDAPSLREVEGGKYFTYSFTAIFLSSNA